MKALSRAWRDTNALGRFRSTTSGVGGIVGIAAAIVGLYFFGSDEGLRDQIIVVAALIVGGVLLTNIAFFGWNLVRAPHRLLHDEVRALAGRVSSLEANRPGDQGNALRLALFAVRSELRTCEIAIEEALDAGIWWNPGPDPLPATSRSEHAAGLASPALHPHTRRDIDEAYQRCHQMNRRIGNYLDLHERSHPFGLVTLPASVFRMREGDEEELEAARIAVERARDEIAPYLGDEP